jgi:hypothetical protein
MEIVSYDNKLLKDLVAQLVERKLIFGFGSRYSSLVSPSYTCLTVAEAREVETDLSHLWSLYRVWSELYLSSVRRQAPDWIRRFTEYRLSPRKIRGHRLLAHSWLEPRMCRVDYVSLGENRKIAEIQWKSGGLGLFFGIQSVYAAVAPCSANTQPIGNLTESLFRLILDSTGANDGVAVNGVRNHWFKSEHYLKHLAAGRGLSWFPVIRDELPMRIIERSGQYFVSEGGFLHPIAFLYGLEHGNAFRQGFERLAQATVEGRIWVETPLNFVYRQKWGLALPFMAEFKGMFDERLREVIIPTVLLNQQPLDLSPIVEHMTHAERERLLQVRNLDDIPDLPGSLRKHLVFKCGAGRGGFHSHGKGVFRVGGSKASAQKMIDFIKERMVTENEPWIVQQYVQQTYLVSMCLPDDIDRMQEVAAHARFMVFGARYTEEQPTIMGGLGNYGAHWKVSGRSPGIDDRGNLIGTAFNDMRVCCGKEDTS